MKIKGNYKSLGDEGGKNKERDRERVKVQKYKISTGE